MEKKQPFKALSKICLNNWHYIDKKILTFNEGINFFTGHSGSGKSTVIDAIQVVLYASGNGRGFFNKAAADDSDRTLIEYLRGMVNISENNNKTDVIEKKIDALENKISNIKFIPYQDKKDLNISLNTADVHLVTNAKGIKGISVPSKIYGCLATNIPVFGILEKGSEAANIIKESNCGILVETGNYKEIKRNLDIIIKDKYKFIKKHSTGRKYLEKGFTKDKSIEKYADVINEVLK